MYRSAVSPPTRRNESVRVRVQLEGMLKKDPYFGGHDSDKQQQTQNN